MTGDVLAPVAPGVALAWAIGAAIVGAEATRRALFRRAELGAWPTPPRVLVIRPCAGHERWLDRALRSLARSRRSFDLRCRFALAEPSDPALGAALSAAEELADSGADARVIFTAARGPNRKAGQLAAVMAAERERPDVVIVADSDVDLEGADLDALLAPLAPGAPFDAAWAPPVEIGAAETLADRASASLLGASLHAFPLLAGLDRGGFVGKLFAVRVEALEAVGGFEALVGHLGEDVELGRRLRAAGRRVTPAPLIARSLVRGRSVPQVVDRYARWLAVIRAQRPALLASYPLLFLAAPLAVGLALAGAPGSPALATAAVATAITGRMGVALAASIASGRRRGPLALALDAALADALLAAAFVRALVDRRVVWRDVSLSFDPAGILREEPRSV